MPVRLNVLTKRLRIRSLKYRDVGREVGGGVGGGVPEFDRLI